MLEEDLTRLFLDIRAILVDIAKTQRQTLALLREQAALDGTTVTNVFTIPSGSPVVKIDFVEAKHANVPKNVSFTVPLVPVASFMLTNDGPGTLLYSTNKGLVQFEAASKLNNGETRTIALDKRAIRQLNLVPNGGACAVRLEVLT